jgi:hypothetical protein
MIITALWGVAQCSLVETDRRFRRVYCFHQAMSRTQTKEWVKI